MSRSEKEVDKSNNDVVSIPGYFIKKNNKRGARHGPSERQLMYYKAQEMLHKARQKKRGGHSYVLCEVAQRIQLQRFVDTHWMD